MTTTPPMSATELKAADLARRWGVSAKTVNRLADEGALCGTRIGQRWRFSEASALAYEQANKLARQGTELRTAS